MADDLGRFSSIKPNIPSQFLKSCNIAHRRCCARRPSIAFWMVVGMRRVGMPQTIARDSGLSQRQATGSTITIGSVVMPLDVLVGIIAGGVAGLLLIGLSIFYGIRWQNRRMARRLQEGTELDKEIGVKLRRRDPAEGCAPAPHRRSFNPFNPDHVQQPSPIFDPYTIPEPRRAQSKIGRLSPSKSFKRMSSLRDSWPLVSNVTMPNMKLFSFPERPLRVKNVAPPGYELTPSPGGPKPTYTGIPGALVSDNSFEGRPAPEFESHAASIQRRMSQNESPSKLRRSASQRLKAAHRRSLTQTWSTIGRFPGMPPSSRLPSPPPSSPIRPTTESQEVLLDHGHTRSFASSLDEMVLNLTPSPSKMIARSAGQVYRKRGRSPTTEISDDDSLIGVDAPDTMPAQLSSPSKRGRRTERHRISVASIEADYTAGAMQNDSRAYAPGSSLNRSTSSVPHRISLASDPFYSHVKSKRVSDLIKGPRVPDTRNATFGVRGGRGSPLTSISGNQMDQSGLIEPEATSAPAEDTPNPFQWTTQEAMKSRSTSSSPTKHKRDSTKGHKRSHIVRISGLPRPLSVCAVPEESEEDLSPTSVPTKAQSSHATIRLVQHTPSLASIASRRGSMIIQPLTIKPPTATTFSPSLSAPDLKSTPPRTADEEPYSPTMSVCDYYSAENTPEEAFFKHARSSTTLAMKHKRRQGRNFSVEVENPSTIISFPPLSANEVTDELPPSPPRPTSQMSVTDRALKSFPAVPAPPVLTITIPGHLTGPRLEPRNDTSPIMLAKRVSVKSSVGQLRRMNSDVSCISQAYEDDEGSPSLPPRSPKRLLFSEPSSIRGSVAYHSMANTSPKRREARKTANRRRRLTHSESRDSVSNNQELT